MAMAVHRSTFEAGGGLRAVGAGGNREEWAARWLPHHALSDGALTGVRLADDRDCAPAETPAAAARRRLGAAMELADGLLRLGCPLLATVPVSGDDLCDPSVIDMAEAWSRARGGAHGLIGFEIGVGVGGSPPWFGWARVATLGYEFTLASADLLESWPDHLGAARLVSCASLARRAPWDDEAAAVILDLAERARASGAELLLRGDLTPEAGAWLRERIDVPVAWQPDSIGFAHDAEELGAQARPLMRDAGVAAAGSARIRGRARRVDDLTWVEVI